MEKFLERQKPLKLCQEETDHLNRTIMNKEIKLVKIGQPGWLSSLALPSTQGVILETWDRVSHRAPCVKRASPSACVSASSLSLCLYE